MSECLEISGKRIGLGYPVLIVAEMSANHNQNFDEAVKIIHAAKECGADAIKLQTYTPDTITVDSDEEWFKIKGTIWEGETLYNLYSKAYTPWEWQPKLKKIADELGIILFSSPFDKSSVDFLELMEVPVYKIASFELVDIPLIEYISSKGKPVIMSTGMASLNEMSEAIEAARGAGAKELALLKCTSAYPAPTGEMNLRAIPNLAEAFNVVTGISDHTLSMVVPVASVAVGACIIEKHFTLSRRKQSADSAFSLEPDEFNAMVQSVRTTEKALGEVKYAVGKEEASSRVFRRSLFVVKDIKAEEVFTKENVRSIRPGFGLSPKYLKDVLGNTAQIDIKRGTPLSWELIDK
jgi:pseudaminic acid synthase